MTHYVLHDATEILYTSDDLADVIEQATFNFPSAHAIVKTDRKKVTVNKCFSLPCVALVERTVMMM